MDLLKKLCALDRQTIIIVVLCIIIAVLLYLNNVRANDFDARLSRCDCSTEHLEVIGSGTRQDTPEQNKLSEKSKLVVYYTDWCGHSKSFLKEWDENLVPAVESANDVKNKVELVKVNCEQNQIECAKNKVEGYPTTILHLSNGSSHEYNDERTTTKIMAFIRKYI